MKSTAKAIALFRDLADKLKIRLASKVITQSTDAQGWPMIIVSADATPATGESVIALRCSAADAVSKDVFGNSLTAFAPHAIELGYELDANGKPTPAATDLMTVAREVFAIGAKVQVKEIANGTVPSEAALNAAAAAIELEDLYWPTKGV
jgi:hypothetical protein